MTKGHDGKAPSIISSACAKCATSIALQISKTAPIGAAERYSTDRLLDEVEHDPPLRPLLGDLAFRRAIGSAGYMTVRRCYSTEKTIAEASAGIKS